MNVRQLLQQPGIWRGRAGTPRRNSQALSTGCDALDRELPQGGWPPGALTEVLVAQEGAGELTLVLPALRELVRQKRRILLVAPPHVPYAPALEQQGIDAASILVVDAGGDGLWAAEQALRSGVCGAVLCWPRRADDRALRRLQLAAEQGRSHGFVFRPVAASRSASPAAMRIGVRPWGELELLKCRGAIVRQTRLTLPPRGSVHRP
ncbi:MAG: translesion DNA synthesis-associated protein ImuA [Pseudomonadota bacterium]